MPNKLLSLSVILGVVIGAAAVVKGTHAYFTASTTSATNTFKTADTFPSISPVPGNIVINEVDPNGGSDEDWIELYNPKSSDVNISGWSITDNSGGINILPNVNPIPSHGYAIIITDTNTTTASQIPVGDVIVVLTSGTIGKQGGLSTNGDEVHLNDGTKDVDSMSFGSDASIFTIATPSANLTLQRFPNGVDTDQASDWHTAPETLGLTNQ